MNVACRRTLVVESIGLSEIRAYANNPRKHSPRQVQKIAASITEFGFTNPILIDESSEIIAGHGRFAAATLLKLARVPAIRISGLSLSQKRALRIFDNRSVEGSMWENNKLAEELEFLISVDFDIQLSGFDAIDLDAILTPDSDGEGEALVTDVGSASTTAGRGDLWQLGQHLVICGDARHADTFSKLLGGAKADMVFTDPPYNVPIPGNVSGMGRATHQNFEMACGEMTPAQFRSFLAETLGNGRDFSRDGSLHYVCMDWRGIGLLDAVGRDLFSNLMNICVWVKSNAGMGSFYRSQHEMIAVFKHGSAAHVNNVQLGRMGRNRSNVWQFAGASSFSLSRAKDLSDHPTVKPLALVQDAIRDGSKPGDLILDPFGGAGTTLLAAEETKRKAALIEIDPKYVDVILTRFKSKTGLEPVLYPDNTPMSKVAELRSREGADHDR